MRMYLQLNFWMERKGGKDETPWEPPRLSKTALGYCANVIWEWSIPPSKSPQANRHLRNEESVLLFRSSRPFATFTLATT